MKRAERQPYIALVTELNELNPRDDTRFPLCCLCRYDHSDMDACDCQHPLRIVRNTLAEQMWTDSINDCWGFRPWRPLEKARAVFLAALEDMRVELAEAKA